MAETFSPAWQARRLLRLFERGIHAVTLERCCGAEPLIVEGQRPVCPAGHLPHTGGDRAVISAFAILQN